jgi:hypothetical protein
MQYKSEFVQLINYISVAGSVVLNTGYCDMNYRACRRGRQKGVIA